VPEAVQLLGAMKKLKEKPPVKQALRSSWEDLVLWGEVVDGMLLPMIDLHTDLRGILLAAAKSAHMLFVMYRRHGTGLCSSQLYHDYQVM
jgi:hypothetical protein